MLAPWTLLSGHPPEMHIEAYWINLNLMLPKTWNTTESLCLFQSLQMMCTHWYQLANCKMSVLACVFDISLCWSTQNVVNAEWSWKWSLFQRDIEKHLCAYSQWKAFHRLIPQTISNYIEQLDIYKILFIKLQWTLKDFESAGQLQFLHIRISSWSSC